jgi:hypothetical protein
VVCGEWGGRRAWALRSSERGGDASLSPDRIMKNDGGMDGCLARAFPNGGRREKPSGGHESAAWFWSPSGSRSCHADRRDGIVRDMGQENSVQPNEGKNLRHARGDIAQPELVS